MTQLTRRFVLPLLFPALSPMLLSRAAFASDSGTPEEAKAMAMRAAELLKTAGPDTAFAEFNTGAAFHDRDLYVMVYDPSGKCVSHGANPALIGKALIDLKDTDGKFIIKDLVAVEDTGWVDYKWPRPTTKKIEPKTTYVCTGRRLSHRCRRLQIMPPNRTKRISRARIATCRGGAHRPLSGWPG